MEYSVICMNKKKLLCAIVVVCADILTKNSNKKQNLSLIIGLFAFFFVGGKKHRTDSDTGKSVMTTGFVKYFLSAVWL